MSSSDKKKSQENLKKIRARVVLPKNQAKSLQKEKKEKRKERKEDRQQQKYHLMRCQHHLELPGM